MADVAKLHRLAGAAGYLCCAQDELLGTGHAKWVNELRELIETITMEIAWLENECDGEMKATES
jgi:hypothetical protein